MRAWVHSLTMQEMTLWTVAIVWGFLLGALSMVYPYVAAVLLAVNFVGFVLMRRVPRKSLR